MTYSQYNLVEASDYNTRYAVINNIWSTGAGSYGWGQPSLSTVSASQLVKASESSQPVEWAKLITTLNNISVHEINASANLTVPNTGDIITWLNTFDSTMNTRCDVSGTNNRFGDYSAFSDQGPVYSSYTSAWGSGYSSIASICTVTWNSAEEARYFFNAGGRVNIQISYSGGSGTSQDANWATVCSNAGTMWLQAIAVGGTATGSFGYWQSAGRMYSANGTGAYSSNTLTVDVSGQGTAQLTFITTFTDNHYTGWQDQVTGNFRVTCNVRRPPLRGLINNTWNTATVAFSGTGWSGATYPPTITLSPSTLPSGSTGTAYSQTITASNGTAPYTYAVSAGTLPTGLSLLSNGQLTGTPTVATTYNFTVEATDSLGNTGTQSYSVLINIVLTVLPTTLSVAVVNEAYTQQFSQSGSSSPPYVFDVISGSLPANLSLSSSGNLSGTPNTIGNSTFTVRVTDNDNATGNRAYTLSVITPPAMPVGSFAYDTSNTSCLPANNITTTLYDLSGWNNNATWVPAVGYADSPTPYSSPGNTARWVRFPAHGGNQYYTATIPTTSAQRNVESSASDITIQFVASWYSSATTHIIEVVGDWKLTFTWNSGLLTFERSYYLDGSYFGSYYVSMFVGGSTVYDNQFYSIMVRQQYQYGRTSTFQFKVGIGGDLNRFINSTATSVPGGVSWGPNSPTSPLKIYSDTGALISFKAARLWRNSTSIDFSSSNKEVNGNILYQQTMNIVPIAITNPDTSPVTPVNPTTPYVLPTMYLNDSGTPYYNAQLQVWPQGAGGSLGDFFNTENFVNSGSRPAGATVNVGTSIANIVIPSSPVFGGPVAGTYNWTLGFNNYNSQLLSSNPGFKNLQLTVMPTISPSSLPSGSTALSYSQTLTQYGLQALPVTWSIVDGSLPSGMSLSSGGTLSGTPSSSGVFNFTVKVQDSTIPAGPMGTKPYSLTVTSPVMPEANSFWVTILNTTSIPAVPNATVPTIYDVSGWNNNATWQNPSTYPLYSASTVNPYLTLNGGGSNQYNASVGSTGLQVVPTDSASDITLQIVWANSIGGGEIEILQYSGGLLQWSLVIGQSNAAFTRNLRDGSGTLIVPASLNCVMQYDANRYQNLFVKVKRGDANPTYTNVYMQYGYQSNPKLFDNNFTWYNGGGSYNYGNSGSGQLAIKVNSGQFRFKSFRYWRTSNVIDEGSVDVNLNGNRLYMEAMNQLIISPNGNPDPNVEYSLPSYPSGSGVSYHVFTCTGTASAWFASSAFANGATGPPMGSIVVDSPTQCTVVINAEYMPVGTYIWTLVAYNNKDVGFRNLRITFY